MAVSFKTAANDTADVNGSGGNIVLGAPTGIAADDYRAHVLIQIGGSGAPDIGTGMTSLGSITSPLGARLSGKVATGSEGSITHTTPGSESISAGRSITLTGIDPASPIEDSAVGVTSTQSGSVTLPTLDTTVAGCRIVYVILPDDGAAALSMGQALHDTDWNFGGGERLYIYYEDQASAGTTTARTVTFSGSHSVAYWMFAVAPEPVSATPPGPPTAVRPDDAFGYGSEVDLSWTAPASDGGSAITGYRIRRSTDDGDTWTTHTADTGTTATSATLTGLTNGTRYLFEVAAINAEGTGTATVSEWGCTPIADASPQTPPTVTTQSSAPWQLDDIDGTNDDGDFDYRWTGAGVRIYIVDTGVRATHEQFDDITVESGYSVGATGATNDVVNHGTSVAALAAGNVYGVAKDAIIVPIKAFEDDHNTSIPYPTQANLLDVLDWIETNHPGGPAVVNCSFALGTTGSGQIDAAVAQIETMVEAGFVFVLSAGNEGGASTSYEQPAGVPGVVVVGGINDAGNIWSGGSLGPEVDMFGPAESILSARGTGDTATGTSSGTSYTAPIVSGVLAMWLEANPDLEPRQLVDLLLANSDKGVVGGTLLGSANRKLNLNADIPPSTTDLTVADMSVAVTVDTPTLTQVHSLVVADASVATTIDAPTLTQTHQLIVADLTVATTIESPTLAQVHVLAVSDLAVAVTAEAPTLTQVHNLVVADLNVPATIDGPTLTQVHNLAVSDLTVAVTIESPTLTVGAVELVVADLAVTSSIDAPTLTQVHQLVVADMSVTTTIDAPTLTVDGVDLVVADLAVASTIDTVDLTQVHVLAVADLTVPVTIDAPTLTVDATVLTVADLLVEVTLEAPTLTQVHQLTVADLAITTTIDAPTLAQVHSLTVASLAIPTSIDSVVLVVPPDFTTPIVVLDVGHRTTVQNVDYRTGVVDVDYRTEVTI